MICGDQSRGLDMSYILWGGRLEGGYRREGRGVGLSLGKGQVCGEGKTYLRAAVRP